MSLETIAQAPVLPLSVPLVYVVDDDESIRRSLARLFRSAKLPIRTPLNMPANEFRAAHCLVPRLLKKKLIRLSCIQMFAAL